MTYQDPSLGYQTPGPGAAANSLGIAGFVVSIIGILTCGILAPIGAILSLVGMRREPRTLALAGLIIGIVGTLELLVVGALVVSASMATARGVRTFTTTVQTMTNAIQAVEDIETFKSTHGNVLPEDADGNTAIAARRDGWLRPFRYHKFNEDRAEIRSAGQDGLFDTGDDQDYPVGAAATFPSTFPAGAGFPPRPGPPSPSPTLPE